MNELSLFSGAGGGLLGSKLLGWHLVGCVEFNAYCQRVLAQRMKDGHIETAPIFTDIREFIQSGAADQYRGVADVVTGGFPCQPFSVAGARKADADERDMWPHTAEVIRRVQPRVCYLENVPGLLSAGGGGVEDGTGRPAASYFGTVLRNLAEMGYSVRWGVLSSADVGAYHRRDRLWIAAHADQHGQSTGSVDA